MDSNVEIKRNKGRTLKIIKIVKIDNKEEFGMSLELFFNIIRIGLFSLINPLTFTFLFGVYKVNILTQIFVGRSK
jgi:hypothetical protein